MRVTTTLALCALAGFVIALVSIENEWPLWLAAVLGGTAGLTVGLTSNAIAAHKKVRNNSGPTT